jgi:hypothetical protein
MNNTIKTLATSMIHSAIKRESVTIGDVTFGPDELKAGGKALAVHGELVNTLDRALNRLLDIRGEINFSEDIDAIKDVLDRAQ